MIDPPSPLTHRIGLAGGEGVHVGEAEIAGAVGAVGGEFLAFDDGEGGVDVAHVVAVGDAVEMEEEGIQLGAEVETPGFVPGVRRQHSAGRVHVAHVAGEGGHVVGGVGEFQGPLP